MPCAEPKRAERGEQRIGHRLGDLDIPRHYRGRIARAKHRAFRQDDADRPETPRVYRDVVVDHHPEHVEHGGARDRLGRVEVRRLLRRRAGEIDRRFAPGLVDADPDLDDRALVGDARRLAVRQPVDHAAHAFVGVVLHVTHIGLDDAKREHLDHAPELARALLVGRDLGLEVVDVLQRVARRIGAAGQEVVELAFAEAALADEQEIIDIDALFEDRRCERATSTQARSRRYRRDGRAKPSRTGSSGRPRRIPACRR